MRVGDKVLVGPVDVAAISETDTGVLVRHPYEPSRGWSVKPDAVLPFSPALPKVAAWLVETEDAVDVVTIGLNSIEAINEYKYDGECGFVLTDMNKIRDRNAIAALRSLIAALTPEAGDAGART